MTTQPAHDPGAAGFGEPVRAATAAEHNRLANARREGPFLAWRDGEGALGLTLLQPGVAATIGRDQESVVPVPHSLVSRDHAVVLLRVRSRADERSVYVQDAGSRHGTELRLLARERGAEIAAPSMVAVPSVPANPLRLAAGDYDLRLAGVAWLRIGGVPLDVGATGGAGAQLPAPTPRERAVLVELCRRQFMAPHHRVSSPSNAEIASSLTPPIGAERVSDILSQLYAKYGLAGTKEQNRSDLVDLAIRHRLVSHEHFD